MVLLLCKPVILLLWMVKFSRIRLPPELMNRIERKLENSAIVTPAAHYLFLPGLCLKAEGDEKRENTLTLYKVGTVLKKFSQGCKSPVWKLDYAPEASLAHPTQLPTIVGFPVFLTLKYNSYHP